MIARRFGIILVCIAAMLAPSAAAHDGIPVTWWLDQPTAASKLRVRVRETVRPSALQWIRTRCSGLRPRAERDGRVVYKHFSCKALVRVDPGVNYTFFHRVHVVGPRGRITLGG